MPKTPPVPSFPKKKKSTTLESLFKLDSDTDAILQASPGAPSDDLLLMISNCSQTFTFTDPSESPSQQDLKRHGLLHVLSILRTTRCRLDDRVIPPLVSMVATNLFRPFPPTAYPHLLYDSYDDDLPAMVLAPAWPHLHIVYDILAVMVSNIDPNSLRPHLDRSFLLNLLALFQSEDPRERDRLKNIYHQLYSKMTTDRSFMRWSMCNAFLHFATEMERQCGIGELLEISGSIINGFTVPLKEEHKVFLTRVLIPLHKPKGLCMYHRQLSYCIAQFVQKDPGLSMAVVKGILRYWPVTNCPKEMLLIGELEDLVEVMEPEESDKVAVILCSQAAKSMTSCNSQVNACLSYSIVCFLFFHCLLFFFFDDRIFLGYINFVLL